MKFTCVVDINLPIDQVILLFDNPENLKHWQAGLVSFEPISGVPGQVGAKSRLLFQMGRRQVELIETIKVRNLPHEFSGTYESKDMYNIVKNFFKPISRNRTRYTSEQEFQFQGLMRVLAFFMSFAFKKQSRKFMEHFKEFAERSAAH